MTLRVDAIRACLEGVIPGVMATSAADGTPNVAYLSQVQFVDSDHIALSFQFFNKTRSNVLANPRATLLLIDPHTAAMYRLQVQYLRTETGGPLFEAMKAKLAGIASHTGMSGVFRLRGSDIYRVLDVERVPGQPLPEVPPRRNSLAALRRCCERLSACADLACLLEETLAALADEFAVTHAMILLRDGARLYTVASCGYANSGIGSEIPLGHGVIGVAAREGTPIRISHMTGEYIYSRAIRAGAEQGELAALLETEIPLPGLSESRSQLAVPIAAFGRELGVVFVESPFDLGFTYDDEDALVSLAAQLGLAILHLQQAETEEAAPEPKSAAVATPQGEPLRVRYFDADHSIFLDDDYLIKGVAGAIFWKLASTYVQARRDTFTNRELRLEPSLRLPDVSDNLEARLILLARRLAERDTCVRIEKTGRGRFRLCVNRPLQLQQIGAGR